MEQKNEGLRPLDEEAVRLILIEAMVDYNAEHMTRLLNSSKKSLKIPDMSDIPRKWAKEICERFGRSAVDTQEESPRIWQEEAIKDLQKRNYRRVNMPTPTVEVEWPENPFIKGNEIAIGFDIALGFCIQAHAKAVKGGSE